MDNKSLNNSSTKRFLLNPLPDGMETPGEAKRLVEEYGNQPGNMAIARKQFGQGKKNII